MPIGPDSPFHLRAFTAFPAIDAQFTNARTPRADCDVAGQEEFGISFVEFHSNMFAKMACRQ